ncbi:hypothetical protein CsSME_00026300 [Camellia sinensis var. sinensis]
MQPMYASKHANNSSMQQHATISCNATNIREEELPSYRILIPKLPKQAKTKFKSLHTLTPNHLNNLTKAYERGKGAKGSWLLGEANTVGQASPRSLAKGFKLLEGKGGQRFTPAKNCTGRKRGVKGSHQPKTARGGVMVHSSWHSWHVPCLKGAKESHQPAKEVAGRIKCRPAKYSADRPLILRNHGRWHP